MNKVVLSTITASLLGVFVGTGFMHTSATILNPGNSYHIIETGYSEDPGAYINYYVETDYSGFTVGSCCQAKSYTDYSMQNDVWIYAPPCGPDVDNCPTWLQSTVQMYRGSEVGESGGWYPDTGGFTEAENGGVYQSFCTLPLGTLPLFDVSQGGWAVQTTGTIDEEYNSHHQVVGWASTYQIEVINDNLKSNQVQASWTNTCGDVWNYWNFDDEEGLVVGVPNVPAEFYPLHTSDMFFQHVDLWSNFNSLSYDKEGSETGESSNLYIEPTSWNLDSYNSGYLYTVSSTLLTESK